VISILVLSIEILPTKASGLNQTFEFNINISERLISWRNGMNCFKCTKRTNNDKKNKAICGACREVLKYDLVKAVLELDPIYLSESNRHKTGRKHKLIANDEHDIYYACKYNTASLSSLARRYGVSKSTIFNIVHRFS
jgi:hypothetical protein